jgi:type II secretory pathway pseudopilin PulG
MDGGGNLPIGPGIWGFIAFFVLAIALTLLVRNMNSRLRRMAYSDRERAQAAEAEAAQAAEAVQAEEQPDTAGAAEHEAPEPGGRTGTQPDDEPGDGTTGRPRDQR